MNLYLPGSSLVKNFRYRAIHAVITKSVGVNGSSRFINEAVVQQSTTMHGVLQIVLGKLEYYATGTTTVERLIALENKFNQDIGASQDKQEFDAVLAQFQHTDLIRTLVAFREAMADHYNYMYDDFCQNLLRYGAFVINNMTTQ